MPCPARVSSDAATLRHTRSGLVVDTKLGTVATSPFKMFKARSSCAQVNSGRAKCIVRPKACFRVSQRRSAEHPLLSFCGHGMRARRLGRIVQIFLGGTSPSNFPGCSQKIKRRWGRQFDLAFTCWGLGGLCKKDGRGYKACLGFGQFVSRAPPVDSVSGQCMRLRDSHIKNGRGVG